MLVFFDGEALEPTLPHVTTAAIVPMVTAHMGGHQPLHPAAQVAVLVWPDHQMEMVGHQTKANYAHRLTQTRVADQPQKGLVIGILVKDHLLAITTIQDVVT